jgi:hypothetical protein
LTIKSISNTKYSMSILALLPLRPADKRQPSGSLQYL